MTEQQSNSFESKPPSYRRHDGTILPIPFFITTSEPLTEDQRKNLELLRQAQAADASAIGDS